MSALSNHICECLNMISIKAVYCGLCKDMGRRYGFVDHALPLATISHFLSLMDLSVRGVKLDAEKQRCIAHPLKKTMCAKCTCNLKYTSSAAVILTYHKLRDDIADKGLKASLPHLHFCLFQKAL